MTGQVTALRLFGGRVGPRAYLAAGIVFFTVKYIMDAVVAMQFFGRPWLLLEALEPSRFYGIWSAPREELPFLAVLFALSVPFIIFGSALTVRRLRDAGLPLWLAALFLVPIINVPFFIALSLVRPRQDDEPHVELAELEEELPADFRLMLLTGVGVGLGGTLVTATAANVFQSYGTALFYGLPFLMGAVSAQIYGIKSPKPLIGCILTGAVSMLVACSALMMSALEGLLCLVMYLPLGLFLGLLGSFVGYLVQAHGWAQRQSDALRLYAMGFLALPLLIAGETQRMPPPPLRHVSTEIIVNAPPAAVWPHVIQFPRLAEPSELMFRAGVAYPIEARIEGRGVGAIRFCVFSTGAFVEPITVWDEPSCLAFSVSHNPPPMRELSPFDTVHAPHLHGFLESRRGEFRLEALEGGRTRLSGTTWYTNRMWPQWYWGAAADAIIHRIHSRVLDHVGACAIAAQPAP